MFFLNELTYENTDAHNSKFIKGRRFIKDVRAKIFQSIEFLKFLLQVDNELLVPEMQKKLGVTVYVSEIKRVVNYNDFEK